MSGSERFDVVVCGGGITGAGIARDAALRGLRVALLDQSDFGSGTSSKSSKLIHGGLRYLQHAELRLVFEGTNERAVQMRVAPHLVRPVPFLVPIYRGQRPGLLTIGLGLWLYDALALFRVPRLHRTYRGARARALEPAIGTAGLQGILEYYDCVTDDARLVLENVIDARLLGADVRSYTRMTDVVRDAHGRIAAVRATDVLTGSVTELATRALVAAVGPWTDALAPMLGVTRTGPWLRPTKGVHIVVDHARVPVSRAVTMFTDDGRAIFCIPWIERTVIGTTDTDDTGDPGAAAATAADVAYLCQQTNAFVPGTALGPGDVIATWAGLRPLLASDADAPGAVSREHHVVTRPEGVVMIAGGKLTTYRRMAKEAVDAVVKLLAATNGHATVAACATQARPLPGARGLTSGNGEDPVAAMARRLAALAPIGPRVATHLAQTYGVNAPAVLGRGLDDPGLLTRIDPELPYLWAEVHHAAAHELVRTVEDVLVRRIPLCLRSRDQGVHAADRVADVLQAALGWSTEERARHLDRFHAYVASTRAYRTTS